MKLIFAVLATLCSSGLSIPLSSPIKRDAVPDAATIRALAPQLGAAPPLKPTGFGDCEGPIIGVNGKPVSVPCTCPPTFDDYVTAMITNVQAGFAVNNTGVAVTFPIGDSPQAKHGRITAAAITLQNLVGPGKGCPLVSTTLGLQSKAIDDGTTASSPSIATTTVTVFITGTPSAQTDRAPVTVTVSVTVTASAATALSSTISTSDVPSGSSPQGLTANQIIALAPSLGVVAGSLKPTGHGDCFGPIIGKDGQPITVPCSCPPTDDIYHLALVQNIFAGLAVNNTVVKMDSYPASNSIADQEARINAAAVTLQNLQGPGKGCPIVSTTLGTQRAALVG